jgi:hypothetical protein
MNIPKYAPFLYILMISAFATLKALSRDETLRRELPVVVENEVISHITYSNRGGGGLPNSRQVTNVFVLEKLQTIIFAFESCIVS